MARSFVSVILAAVKCAAPGGIWPPAPRAALRMNSLRALDGSRGDPGPDRRPAQMGDRRHRLRVNLVIGFGKDLFGRALAFSSKPALQVPRMPSVSHSRLRSSV